MPNKLKGLINGYPDYGYGMRYQEPNIKNPPRPKGQGFYGEVNRPNGTGYSTEIGIGTDAYGEIPTMVPGLTEQEMSFLLNMKDTDKIPESIISKAKSHAAWRRLQGQDPFAGINDNKLMMPLNKDPMIYLK
jgi:hypothetical protein